MKNETKQVETTGHVWDEDLQEYNNPLPRWWLWTFYITIIFAVSYWFMYPTFPMGDGFTRGMATITYTNAKGETKTVPWNTRNLLVQEMNESSSAVKQKEFLDKIGKMDYSAIANDKDLDGFVNSLGKALFSDNCAACHQQGGAGIVGLYPNLVDDDWLWGGSFANIEHTIREGRYGFMPGFSKVLDDKQIDDLATYVLSLSGEKGDEKQVQSGKTLFHSDTAACYYCHTEKATGLFSQGSANLTDQVWTIANISLNTDAATKKAEVKKVITQGVSRHMPTWKDRLSDTDIKLLTVYVHDLGGGK